MKKIIYIIMIVLIISFYELNVQSGEPYTLRLPPTLPTYTTTVTDTAPNLGGYGYTYAATASYGLLVSASGVTNPIVDLKAYLPGSTTPLADGAQVQGIINLKTYVQSFSNINKYQLYLYKYDKTTLIYKPVKVNPSLAGVYCSFCQTEKCNLLEEKTYSASICISVNECTFTFAWDTTKCDNQNFMINVTAYDYYPNPITQYNYNTDEIFLTLNNPGAPVIVEGGIQRLFSSELLNTVYLKIKSWIT